MSTYFKFEDMCKMWKKCSKITQLCVISIFLTILTIVLSAAMASVYMLRDVSYNVPLEGNSATKITMVTHYISIDATAGTLTADWYPLAYNCQDPEEVVNIYFDPNVLIGGAQAASPQIASDKPPEQPTFQFNTKTRCHMGIRDSLATFRTVTKLIGQRTNTRLSGPSLQCQWYPRDIYFAQFSLFAQLNSTNASVGITTATPFGAPENFDVALDQKQSKNTGQGLLLRLIVTRSTAVQVLVGFIVMANWIASIAFLWITIASFLWPESVVKELFVIPIASLFAFTSVRSNMPGAPVGFGAFIDFIGILPNLALMAVCSATLLLVVLVRRTCEEEDREKHQNQDPLNDRPGQPPGQNQDTAQNTRESQNATPVSNETLDTIARAEQAVGATNT